MKLVEILLIVIVVAVLAFSSINIVGFFTLTTGDSMDGLLVTDIDVDQNAVYLASGCYVLPIAITEHQVFSIAMGVNDIINVRPVSHDLIKDLAENYDIDILGVNIHRFDNGTYYARLVVRQGNRMLDMDARPSDAIAVAVRTKSPIYVKQSVMETQGENFC